MSDILTSATPAGFVETTEGSVTVTRADGSQVTLKPGDPVFEGDTLETGSDAGISITFIDQGTMALGENGEMSIDAMVYDADEQSGESAINVVEGVFVYASGMIAKTDPDAMEISTPVASIGIRGTKIVGRADPDGGENVVTLLEEDDGFVGEIVVTTDGGTQVLNQVNQTTTVTPGGDAPTDPVMLQMSDIRNLYGDRKDLVPAHRQNEDRNDPAAAQPEAGEDADALPGDEEALEDGDGEAAEAAEDDPEQMLDAEIAELAEMATAAGGELSGEALTGDAAFIPTRLPREDEAGEEGADVPWTDEMIEAWREARMRELAERVESGELPEDAFEAAMAQLDELYWMRKGQLLDDDERNELTAGSRADAGLDVDAGDTDQSETLSMDGDGEPEDWQTGSMATAAAGTVPTDTVIQMSDPLIARGFEMPDPNDYRQDPAWGDRVDAQIVNIFEHAHSGEMTQAEAEHALRWLADVIEQDRGFEGMAEVLYAQLHEVRKHGPMEPLHEPAFDHTMPPPEVPESASDPKEAEFAGVEVDRVVADPDSFVTAAGPAPMEDHVAAPETIQHPEPEMDHTAVLESIGLNLGEHEPYQEPAAWSVNVEENVHHILDHAQSGHMTADQAEHAMLWLKDVMTEQPELVGVFAEVEPELKEFKTAFEAGAYADKDATHDEPHHEHADGYTTADTSAEAQVPADQIA